MNANRKNCPRALCPPEYRIKDENLDFRKATNSNKSSHADFEAGSSRSCVSGIDGLTKFVYLELLI